MVRARKCGLMNLFMRGSISKARNTDLVYIRGQMALGMKVNGMKTKYVAWVHTPG